jgi:hypothetical protein
MSVAGPDVTGAETAAGKAIPTGPVGSDATYMSREWSLGGESNS